MNAKGNPIKIIMECQINISQTPRSFSMPNNKCGIERTNVTKKKGIGINNIHLRNFKKGDVHKLDFCRS